MKRNAPKTKIKTLQKISEKISDLKIFQKFSLINPKIKKRIISSLILIPIVLYAVYEGGYFYFTMVLIVSILAFVEWLFIVSRGERTKEQLWQLDIYALGLLYACLFCWAMIFLRAQNHGFSIVMWCVLLTWATDIGAYVAGSYFKGPKFAPSISPNKTWIGAISGVFFGGLVGVFFKDTLFATPLGDTLTLSIILSIVAQIGDLIESWFKRKFHVKDSGKLIPGHGGVLDRIDSLGAVVLIAAIIIYFS